jgi:hypothetical protein
MPIEEAELVFQGYPTHKQLEIISSTRDPRKREELFYFVPDCTELIQLSSTEDMLQIISTSLGTGYASILIPCLSSDQLEEMIDIAVWKDGKLDERSLDIWLFELSLCDCEDLSQFLYQIDISILASMLRGRFEINSEFLALMIESGTIDPSSKEIQFKDERSKHILDAIWAADENLFTRLLYEVFGLDQEDIASESSASLERAKEKRDQRVEEKDRQMGVHVTEEQILQTVDLKKINLKDDEDE